MSEYQLISEILQLSKSQNWDGAKLEWELELIYEENEPDTCLCGHFPIIEICVLKNKINNNSAIVGNCCVKKFIGLPTDKIFQALKRIRKDIEKSVNAETIEYSYKNHWIKENARDFYLDIMRKRNLSEEQLGWKISINKIILRKFRESSQERCPKCGSLMKLRVPKPDQTWKPFLGCTKYPDCKYSKNI